MFRKPGIYGLSGILLLTGGIAVLLSQTPSRELIHSQIDENRLVTLSGNTRPEVQTGTDLGAVSDDLPLDHMMLQLKRSDAQEEVVERFIDELHNPNSPDFHKWLTPSEFGQRFGIAETDIRKIDGWLESHGFTLNGVYPSNMLVDFSGNAGQVREAFHTSIHNLDVNGQHHIANFSDPQIPEALNAVVASVVSLHDFRPHRMSRARAKKNSAQYTYGAGDQTVNAMVPADLATIYDFNPLFANGITGKGQTIVVLEDTNLYRTSDWTTFRSTFGLSQYTTGTLTTVQPAGSLASCGSPGVNSDDIEAILDVEWASAAAPGAAIEVASCGDTAVSDGVLIAGLNITNATPVIPIMSVSYGGCEAENGAGYNKTWSTLFQQAVAEGISVFVSAGDEDAASCDQGEESATHGIGVAGQASTPYNVAVGGTDFGDVYAGTSSTYWGPANSTTYGSALSYIPEIPWNDSCASGLLAQSMGYSTGYGAGGFCASATARAGGYLVVGGGSGGPSGCASGTPAVSGVVGGSCQGIPKPSWQTGVAGIPNDGVRDIPDVSMFASDGPAWGHSYIICYSDISNGGAPCRGVPSNWTTNIGGTSFASPIMAGVQALINQSVGGAQGNPNVEYYKLAAKNSSVFHTVMQGDIDVNCGGTTNCFGYIGTVDYGRGGRIFGTTIGGALSTSTSGFQPAYAAGSAWNFATGLGSVDVNALVANWGK